MSTPWNLLLLLALTTPATSRAQRTTTSATGHVETRTLPPFTAIDVTDGIQLTVQPGPAAGAVVEASTAQFRRMTKTEVVGGVLRVYFDYQHEPNWTGLVNSREVFKVTVTTGELRRVQAADGAVVTLARQLDYGPAHALDVQLRAGAELRGEVHPARLRVQLSGGSAAECGGTARVLHARVAQGSRLHCPQLQADSCTVAASGASSARFVARKTLDASAVNEASITYGGPAELTRQHREQGGQILHF